MRRLFTLLVCLVAAAANARVISYAPYTSQNAIPGLQSRTNRHFVLYESDPSGANGQVVLYDTKGLEEPRVIYSGGASMVAMREDDQQMAVLVSTFDSGGNRSWRISTDAGATWKTFTISGNVNTSLWYAAPDTGGAFVRSRYSQIRIGTHDYPFVMMATDSYSSTLYAVKNDG